MSGFRTRLAPALFLGGALLTASPPSRAAAPSVRVEALPLFGAQSPMGEGWASVSVRLVNTESKEVSGVVEIRAKPSWSNDTQRLLTSAPFALAPKARVALELPTHGFASSPTELELAVVDRSGTEIATLPVPEFRQMDPLLLDFSVPSRIAPAVRGVGLVTQRTVGGGYRTPSALVTSPLVDPATGDPVLPRWAASYGSATLVVTTGRILGTLRKPELRALADWVLAGGALAVTVDRPEDLRLDLVTTLAGGAVERTNAAPELFEPELFMIAPEVGGVGPRSLPSPSAASQPTPQPERRGPNAVTAPLLEGFAGGNLRTSPWGSVATYGLGELHLLAFDGTEDYLSDRWTQLKFLDLLRHAWERERAVVLPLGQTGFDGYRTNEIRAVLDPNRSMRWTIIAAALVLLVYASLAGPLNFWLASRRGKPLRALLHLPFWAAGALGLVVALGVLAKGVTGHARRLTLIEAGAGMDRGTATRFRGLYASSSRDITVVPTSRASLLDVSADDEYVERTLVVDRDGARLERLRTKPWATIVVREDGFASLAGGISIVRDASGEVIVKNRSARDLLGVVLKVPGRPAVAFGRVKDGAAVREKDGSPTALSAALPKLGAYGSVHPLSAALLTPELDRHVEGLGAAWKALEEAAPDVDFWVRDVPVLIGALEGGEGKTHDSGFEVDVDRALVRVVGWGGVP
ncbi:MAG TPA: hypothetical protein VFZ53_01220 [Polyangiaceae bacterium]